jgi:hypothetical protein
VVAEHLPVVGRHDDHGVVVLARPCQRIPYPAELVVDFADHAEVLRPHRPDGRLVTGRGGIRIGEGGIVEGMTFGRGSDREADFVGRVGPGPMPCGGVRWVRPPVAEVGEPRFVLTFDPLDGPIRQEGCDAVLGGPFALRGEQLLEARGRLMTPVV